METEASMNPHIAVLSCTALGHIIPLLEFSKRLVDLHHDIRATLLVISTSDDTASSPDAQLLQPSNLPPNLRIVRLPPVDVDKVTSSDMDFLTRYCAVVEESLRSLKSVLADIGIPKALVFDLFCTQAIDVCRELSVPAYSFMTASVSFLAFSLYLQELDRTVSSDLINLFEPIQVPGCSPVRIEDLVEQVHKRKSDQYKWFLFHMSRLSLAHGIFLNSFEDLEPVPLKALRENPYFKGVTPPVYPIGPVTKQCEPEPAEYFSWLNEQPPDSVLFVSLGSGGTLSKEQLTELALGLELSRQRFIWVTRKPTITSGSGAFFNLGSDNNPEDYLPEGFLERTREVGVVVPSWASQVAILRHPSTGGFLSHCGWNSILESVVHGKPMIVWPLYVEQRMNATALVEEIGIAMKPAIGEGETVVGREGVKRVVRMVMEGEEGKVIRRRVKELKESASRAVDGGGSSFETLRQVVEGWKTAGSRGPSECSTN